MACKSLFPSQNGAWRKNTSFFATASASTRDRSFHHYYRTSFACQGICMGALSGIVAAIGRVWSRGCLGKGIVIFVALVILGMCGSILGLNNRSPIPTQPTAQARATTAPAVAQPTAAPEPTAAPIVPTDAPTTAPVPATSAPVLTQPPAPSPVPTLAGVSPASGTDCPADHPVKGNIVDRGANKGQKIYHLPGDNGYAQTKPERCFVNADEATAAGFRPVK